MAATKTKSRSTATNGVGASGEERSLQLRQLDRRLLTVTISGITPLITHKISEHSVLKMAGVKFSKEQEPDQDQQFQSAIYRDDKGRPAFPAAGIRVAMIDAGRSAEIAMTNLTQYFNIASKCEFVPIDGSEPERKTDTPRQKNGQLALAIRAIYPLDWSITFPLVYNAEAISMKDVLSLLNLAGFAVGIGGRRPERRGTFGQFTVTKAEEVRSA